MTEHKITCPECGFNYTHLAGVTFHQAGVITSVDRDGVRVKAGDTGDPRKAEAVISYLCEEGHAFEHRFSFHKGETFQTEAPAGEHDDTGDG